MVMMVSRLTLPCGGGHFGGERRERAASSPGNWTAKVYAQPNLQLKSDGATMKSASSVLLAGALAFATSLMWTPVGLAQGAKQMAEHFQIVEASIDDIQEAYKTGKLTVRQLVQAYLDRIEAYDKNGPKINSIITLNPHALEEADKLDAAYRRSGLGSTAWHSRPGEG
jgi:hypothetical protein